eukprot:TRINITY_DN4009_c0_g1_i1.p1 TRINITY_DN4009_c0_g1~~TRINITY_DN4009_c0_g1_i1.p1  ORF type:complete len:217 (+),score=65.54 TRINITY_DN4009_c0_g1_i1:161-811(+)
MPLFGGKKPTVGPKEAITKLRETIDVLEKREVHLQKKMDNETQAAKTALAKKDKKTALMCLKRKKLYEGQAEKLSGTRMNLEVQVMNLEGANVNLETLKAIKLGAETMKTMHKQYNIDKIDDIMDDAREQMDMATELGDALSQPLAGTEMDEDDLLNELDELEQETIDESLLGMNNVKVPHTGPVIHDHIPARVAPAKVAQRSEEDDLAALEASML